MNFNLKTKTVNFAGGQLHLETGKIARQANGSVLLCFGETKLLATATGSKEAKEDASFFPLTVDFIEKMYSSGKIPGGFFKREARPSTDATLNARVIDRAIRPLFPKGFKNPVHVVITVLSYDEQADLGSLGITAASCALTISDIPFGGPIAGALVGYIDGKIKINPTRSELETSDIELSVAASGESIVMIEAGAKALDESVVTNGIFEALKSLNPIVQMQLDFCKEVGKPKFEFNVETIDKTIEDFVKKSYTQKVLEAIKIEDKLSKYEAISTLKDEIKEKFEENEDVKSYTESFENLVKKIVREKILAGERPDGRDLDDIRPIDVELDILPRAHGSALFTRGETQSLGTVTLGSKHDEQIIDGLNTEYRKNYYLHYNFPPYCVGEAGFMRPPGRRELGHGSLAERALVPVLPSKEDFPYTIRAVSDITESNGSSSMASVCSGSLALMAAGVPISTHVAGIANGLIKEGDDFVILTDIQGMEDHLGDMDFKVCGTKEGITAIQMDIKIDGITKEIMSLALQKAKKARETILQKMESLIATPRVELSKYAPRIESLTIDKDKISEVIGAGGKTIKGIIEETGADINIDDSGLIVLVSTDVEKLKKAKQIIESIVEMPEFGGIYEGEVTRIEVYGAFVKFMFNKMGLVHISKMTRTRLGHPSDILKLGDTVKVRFTGLKEGKIQLEMVGIEGNPDVPKGYKAVERPRQSGNHNRGDRGSRFNRFKRRD